MKEPFQVVIHLTLQVHINICERVAGMAWPASIRRVFHAPRICRVRDEISVCPLVARQCLRTGDAVCLVVRAPGRYDPQGVAPSDVQIEQPVKGLKAAKAAGCHPLFAACLGQQAHDGPQPVGKRRLANDQLVSRPTLAEGKSSSARPRLQNRRRLSPSRSPSELELRSVPFQHSPEVFAPGTNR
jgi:hypothetical protein